MYILTIRCTLRICRRCSRVRPNGNAGEHCMFSALRIENMLHMITEMTRKTDLYRRMVIDSYYVELLTSRVIV